MSKIKAILTDLDDTLLSSSKEIKDEFQEVLKKLKEKNIIFSFITGRPKYATYRYIDELEIEYPVVSCNGAVIFDKENVISKHSFNISVLKDVMKKASELGITVLFYTNDVEYTLKETPWVTKRNAAGRDFPTWKLTEDEWERLQCEKVNLMSDGFTDEFASMKHMIEALENEVSLSMYGLNGCEIVSKEVNKAEGLKEFAKLVGIKENEILAIGDNTNDHDMLKVAGIGVAVGNATEETKQHADYVMKNTYTDAVIEAITTFVLEEEL